MIDMPEIKNGVAKKPFMILLGVILLAFVFLLGYSVGLQQSKKQKGVGYQQAVEDIKGKLADTGLMPPTVETSVINGAVTAVGEGSLDIEAVQLVNNPLEQPAPTRRHITVGAGTKITKQVPKTLEQITSEMTDFDAAMVKFDKAIRAGKEAEPPLLPPSATIEEIKLSDISKGDQVRVVAAENITFSADFAATEIVVLGNRGLPPEPPPPEVPPTGAPTAGTPAADSTGVPPNPPTP